MSREKIERFRGSRRKNVDPKLYKLFRKRHGLPIKTGGLPGYYRAPVTAMFVAAIFIFNGTTVSTGGDLAAAKACTGRRQRSTSTASFAGNGKVAAGKN